MADLLKIGLQDFCGKTRSKMTKKIYFVSKLSDARKYLIGFHRFRCYVLGYVGQATFDI